MNERQIFQKSLMDYYKHLNKRLDKGKKYVDLNPLDEKSYKAYTQIIKELSKVEELINYYKG